MPGPAAAAEPAASIDQPGVHQHLAHVAAFRVDAADDVAAHYHAVHAACLHADDLHAVHAVPLRAEVGPAPAAASAVYAVCGSEASQLEYSDGVECCVAVGRRAADWQLAAAPRDQGS